MALIRNLTYVSVGLLMVDSAIEFSLVSSTIAWLHGRADGSFEVNYRGSRYSLRGRPAHEYASPIYVSLAAALAAFVIIGIGGIWCFFLQSRPNLWRQRWPHVIYTLWIMFLNGSAALTLFALIYTFVANSKNNGVGYIDQTLALQFNNRSSIEPVLYPTGSWTPENWYGALLRLSLVKTSDRDDIAQQVAIMRGWRINLIALFIIGFIVSVFGHWDAMQRRRRLKENRKLEMT